VLDKECLCVGLSNAAAICYDETFIKKRNAVTICPGPNIVNFSRVVSLQTMTDHIYGRKNIITNSSRPHMFIAELHLYLSYFKEQLEAAFMQPGQQAKKKKYFAAFFQNLHDGILYYRHLPGVAASCRDQFTSDLCYAGNELDELNYQYAITTALMKTQET
jgi:hypothetical protein